MEIKAYIKYNKVTPKKLRFLLDDVKKRTPEDALNYLFYNPRRSGKALYKGIKSAVDNAKSAFKIDVNLLKFKTLIVEMGPSLKRYNAGSKGSAKPFVRKMSHIKIVLETIETKNEDGKEKMKVKNEDMKGKMEDEDGKAKKKVVKKVINKLK